MHRGEIYWVEPDETEGCVQKFMRPAVIVSNDMGNKFAPIVEVIYLTSACKSKLPTHVQIYTTAHISIALREQIATISKSRIRQYMGKCTDKEMRQINKGMMISLGIIE